MSAVGLAGVLPLLPRWLGEIRSETDPLELTGGQAGFGREEGRCPVLLPAYVPYVSPPVVLPSLDSASDPGVTAKLLCIDVVKLKGHLCLTFTDNGAGMTPRKLHHVLR